MISLSVEAGRELDDLVPVLGLLDLKKEESVMDGEPGQGDGAESSGVGPGQRQEDVVAWVAILGDDDPVEGDQVAGEEGADSAGQGGEVVSLVAVESFVQTVAGTVTETVQVDRELGERDNMEDEIEPGLTLVAVTEENGEHGNLDFDKFILIIAV